MQSRRAGMFVPQKPPMDAPVKWDFELFPFTLELSYDVAHGLTALH